MMRFLLSLVLFLSLGDLAHAQINAAYYGYAQQSSVFEFGDAENAIDNNTDGRWGNRSVSHTEKERDAWWEVDLGDQFNITDIRLWNRTDCCADRLRNFYIFVSENRLPADADPADLADENFNVFTEDFFEGDQNFEVNTTGRYVRIQHDNRSTLWLSLAEVQVLVENPNKLFQDIALPSIGKVQLQDEITLPEFSDVGLPISYEVVSGDGIIDGNILTFSGDGMVEISATQEGNEDYYPAKVRTVTVEVIDASAVFPRITRHNISEEYPLSMNTLTPINIWASFEIDHPELFFVSERKILINGVDRTVDQLLGEGARAVWQPENYGTHQIEIQATSSAGTFFAESFEIEVTDDNPVVEVTAMDKAEVVWPSKPYNAITTAVLPSFKGQYNRIIASLDITCPDVGCDPFDRIGRFFVKDPEGHWIEIFRYITPFGIECSHEVDITDMASLLQGKTEFRFFVETFSNGWQATLKLRYEPGTPAHDYSRVLPVWDAYFPFGDWANLQPVPFIRYDRSPLAEKAEMRMYTSGHGWGENNTSNAAEFYRTRHHIMVNGNAAFNQDLWYDCNPNPDGCNNQLGTWTFDRAGWCPGAIGQKYVYSLQNWADQSISLGYRFQEQYRDNCHPNNPNCRSGLTCTNCNDGFNPFYVVSAYVVEYGNQIIEGGAITSNEFVMDPADISILPNPARGEWTITLPEDTRVLSGVVRNASGQTVYSVRPTDQSVLQINAPDLPEGLYFLELRTTQGLVNGKLMNIR